jgi:hypothetical protein
LKFTIKKLLIKHLSSWIPVRRWRKTVRRVLADPLNNSPIGRYISRNLDENGATAYLNRKVLISSQKKFNSVIGRIYTVSSGTAKSKRPFKLTKTLKQFLPIRLILSLHLSAIPMSGSCRHGRIKSTIRRSIRMAGRETANEVKSTKKANEYHLRSLLTCSMNSVTVLCFLLLNMILLGG